MKNKAGIREVLTEHLRKERYHMGNAGFSITQKLYPIPDLVAETWTTNFTDGMARVMWLEELLEGMG